MHERLDVIKLFTALIYECSYLAVVFVPGRPFQPRTGHNVIKLFTLVIYESSLKVRVFDTGQPFRPSLMFVSKARSLPCSGAP